jgi:hypothetical protein
MNPKKDILRPRLLLAIALLSLVVMPVFSKAAGSPVLVIRNGDNTSVKIATDLSALKISSVEMCISPERLKQYYDGSAKKYAAIQANLAKCDSKVMQTTTLNSELSDLEASRIVIDQRLKSLGLTAKYLSSLKSLNGINLNGIPAGTIENNAYKFASDITMKCLYKTSPNTDVPSELKAFADGIGASGSVGAVGNLSIDNIPWFNSAPESQLVAMVKFTKELEILNGQIENEIAANGGKMSMKMAMSFGSRLGALTEVIAKDTIMISPEDKENYESVFMSMRKDRNINSGFGVGYNLDANNNKKPDHELSGALAFLASTMGVTDKSFVDTTVTFGNVTFPEVWLPESTMLTSLKNDNTAHIERLNKLRSKLAKVADQLKTKLVALGKDTSCN